MEARIDRSGVHSWNEVDFNFGNTDEMEMWSSQLYLQFKQQQILAQRTFSAPPCSALPTGDPNVCMGADQFIEFIFTRYILATGKDELDKLVIGSNSVEPLNLFFFSG